MNNWDYFHLNSDGFVIHRPTIFQQSADDLKAAITKAIQLHPNFWELLYGFDAYQELRRRRLTFRRRKLWLE